MQTAKKVQQEIDRILSINWVCDEPHIEYGAKLVREFLRWSSQWAIVRGVTSDWAFCDFSRQVDGTISVAPAVESKIRDRLSTSRVSSFHVAQVCLRHLEWTTANSEGLLDGFDLPNPYEPLVRLFELGMTFEIDKGFISVCGVGGIPIGTRDGHNSARPIVDVDRS